MKWIPDASGRFSQRPYYELDELDGECERIISTFLLAKHREVAYPITTNDLTILLDQETSDLDLYADLANEGEEVEGVTDFIPHAKPRVRISKKLSSAPERENRQRTTLTHELGHIKFHAFLWPFDQLNLFENHVQPHSPRCNRETILNAASVDWMEWQAGYASGAYLMPITPLRQIVREILGEDNLQAHTIASAAGIELINRVMSIFHVSEEAARVRLIKRGYLLENMPSLQLKGLG